MGDPKESDSSPAICCTRRRRKLCRDRCFYRACRPKSGDCSYPKTNWFAQTKWKRAVQRELQTLIENAWNSSIKKIGAASGTNRKQGLEHLYVERQVLLWIFSNRLHQFTCFYQHLIGVVVKRRVFKQHSY